MTQQSNYTIFFVDLIVDWDIVTKKITKAKIKKAIKQVEQ